jgi:zinc transport system substrate-binding protein
MFKPGHGSQVLSLVICLMAFVGVVITGCGSEADRLNNKPSVFVSIPPLAFVVEEIAGTLVDLRVLLPPGASPATYEPTPQVMAGLSDADILFRTGVPFEKQLVVKIGAQMPELIVVDVREGIELERTPSHGHDHDHDALDPHIWLDPNLVKQLADTVYDRLARLLPEYEEQLRLNLDSLRVKLTELDANIREVLAGTEGGSFWVFHPAYGYFARRYGLEQVAIESEGKEPSARELAQLMEEAGHEEVRALLIQQQFAGRQAKVIAGELGCELVEVDPLARDYISNMKNMARSIAAALTGGQGKGSESGHGEPTGH